MLSELGVLGELLGAQARELLRRAATRARVWDWEDEAVQPVVEKYRQHLQVTLVALYTCTVTLPRTGTTSLCRRSWRGPWPSPRTGWGRSRAGGRPPS